MTREEIIQGLQFTIDMFLFDPLTGEPITKPRNDMDKTTIDACKGAIELLQQQPYNTSEWCHDCSEYNHDKHCCPRYNKVIRSAVEEMKQPCEDAISRQAVLDVVFESRKNFNSEFDQGFFVDKIRDLPLVQPKTGYWITKIKSDLRGDMWPTNPKCSECGGEPYYSNSIYNYKFCPYCGCKMIEPQAE